MEDFASQARAVFSGGEPPSSEQCVRLELVCVTDTIVIATRPMFLHVFPSHSRHGDRNRCRFCWSLYNGSFRSPITERKHSNHIAYLPRVFPAISKSEGYMKRSEG
jgi:hypothetical protein